MLLIYSYTLPDPKYMAGFHNHESYDNRIKTRKRLLTLFKNFILEGAYQDVLKTIQEDYKFFGVRIDKSDFDPILQKIDKINPLKVNCDGYDSFKLEPEPGEIEINIDFDFEFGDSCILILISIGDVSGIEIMVFVQILFLKKIEKCFSEKVLLTSRTRKWVNNEVVASII